MWQLLKVNRGTLRPMNRCLAYTSTAIFQPKARLVAENLAFGSNSSFASAGRPDRSSAMPIVRKILR